MSATALGSLPTLEHFQAPRGWSASWAQSLRNRVLPADRFDLAEVSTSHDVQVSTSDGSQDRLLVHVHRPRERRGQARSERARGHMVVLVHGLGSSADAVYVKAAARGLLQSGFDVARVNLRGAGPGGQLATGLYHAGRTADLRDVLAHLHADTLRPSSAFIVMGFSLGANLTVKLLGEPLAGLPLTAGIAVSTPLDLAAGVMQIERMAGGLYQRAVMAGLRADALASGRGRGLTPAERDLVRRARTVREFDEAITARRNGYPSADDYYAAASSGPYLARSSVPLLLIHAIDDPLIPVQPYVAVDWSDVHPEGLVTHAFTPIGGHVGFHERGRYYPWYVRRTVNFLASITRS